MEANADHEEENLVNYAHCLFSLKRVSHRTSLRVYKSHLHAWKAGFRACAGLLLLESNKGKTKSPDGTCASNHTAYVCLWRLSLRYVNHWLWHPDKGSLLPTRGRMPRRVSDLLWAHCWTDFLFLDFSLPCSARPNASLFKTINQS